MNQSASVQNKPALFFDESRINPDLIWVGDPQSIVYDTIEIKEVFLNICQPIYIVSNQGRIGATNAGRFFPANTTESSSVTGFTSAPAMPIEHLGDPGFRSTHKTRYAYYVGSMAHGISSVEMIIALGKQGILGSFGAGGLDPIHIENAINRIQAALPNGPYAFNLIYNPFEPSISQKAVELYIKYGITTIEASAFLDITANLVHYRVAGLKQNSKGEIEIRNIVIAKLSRKEVATKFMEPAPLDILKQLVSENRITESQANMAQNIPVADDITVEADSGGHTDNRPLVCLVPTIIALRDELQDKYGYKQTIRVGAAGGIGTCASALAAFSLGAAYIVTGSINQSCVESGTSEHTKELLTQADMADVIMAPATDMFEMGVKVQLLKRGTLFPMRAQKLFDLYKSHDSIEEIPEVERQKLERMFFKRDFETVWEETKEFFYKRDPHPIQRAQSDPKYKMALIFRWYLGLSTHWSNSGEKGREMDYQIWCGPSMGTFNDWTRGTYLMDYKHRKVVDVALQILTGCAYQYRVFLLQSLGLLISPELSNYSPERPLKR
ncbi:MAG: PfaD family polyunsaturated fatty acid/polyketide biosynthesis protein [Anaerolineaceae bacterium]|nr:PfaD family polyunsaturated fatty acid/polyketide biosynthesis protein [Anaerolineaceae bacterium]